MPSKERFAVSHEGKREQHAGGAVQNARDEAPETIIPPTALFQFSRAARRTPYISCTTDAPHPTQLPSKR